MYLWWDNPCDKRFNHRGQAFTVGFQLKYVLFIPFNSLPPAICTDYLIIDVIKEGALETGYR